MDVWLNSCQNNLKFFANKNIFLHFLHSISMIKYFCTDFFMFFTFSTSWPLICKYSSTRSTILIFFFILFLLQKTTSRTMEDYLTSFPTLGSSPWTILSTSSKNPRGEEVKEVETTTPLESQWSPARPPAMVQAASLPLLTPPFQAPTAAATPQHHLPVPRVTTPPRLPPRMHQGAPTCLKQG